MVECPPCNRETGVQIPVGSYQRLLKMGPIASLLGTQHQGLVWGEVLATYWRHVQGVYLYIKLPHAIETGDRLLQYGPNGSRTIGGMVLKATSSSSNCQYVIHIGLEILKRMIYTCM